MDFQLKGKNCVILGGTRGIGRAIADTLADEGANVAICARNGDQVATAVSELKAKGVSATGGSVDVTNGEQLKAWINSAAETLGGIDILISNAGAMAQGNDPDSWKQNFNLDVLGAVNAFDAAEPFLGKAADEKGDAAFVIIASISAAGLPIMLATTARSRRPSFIWPRAWRASMPSAGSGPMLCRRAWSISKAGSGIKSSRICRTFSNRLCPETQRAAALRRKRLPMPRFSWPARFRLTPQART